MGGLGFRSGDEPAIVAGHVAGLPGGFGGPHPAPRLPGIAASPIRSDGPPSMPVTPNAGSDSP